MRPTALLFPDQDLNLLLLRWQTISANCADSHLRTWDVDSAKLLKDKTTPTRPIMLGPDVYVENNDTDKTVRVWDLTADRQIQLLHGAPGRSVARSNDGRQLATSRPDERSVRTWDVGTGEPRRVLADGVGGASVLIFSPDGQNLVSANYDNDIRIWKVSSGELVKKVDDLTGAMFAGGFTPDGKQLIMAGLDETVYIWDAQTFALNRKLTGHGETISALAISPDGRTLVTGGFDVLTSRNPVKIVFHWDLAAGKVIRTPASTAPGGISSPFSPDGKWLAMSAGEKEISLWSPHRNGQVRLTIAFVELPPGPARAAPYRPRQKGQSPDPWTCGLRKPARKRPAERSPSTAATTRSTWYSVCRDPP